VRVTLPPPTRRPHPQKVDTGLRRVHESVGREALRLLEENDGRVLRLRAAIADGEEEVGNATWTVPRSAARLQRWMRIPRLVKLARICPLDSAAIRWHSASSIVEAP
jgi:Arc/MetJ-type ribon-helix-helix transcriptional regulator